MKAIKQLSNIMNKIRFSFNIKKKKLFYIKQINFLFFFLFFLINEMF